MDGERNPYFVGLACYKAVTALRADALNARVIGIFHAHE
jgi:hypothetical protein